MMKDEIELILNSFLPYHGWHDDNRDKEGTPEYMPAMMQVRDEFQIFIGVLSHCNILGGNCLQLGLGNCRASHEVWRLLFKNVTTIDLRQCISNDYVTDGLDTHGDRAIELARSQGPYDLLFIDAGHDHYDVAQDYFDYGPMVRKGGIIAFHDAIRRPKYPEVGVPDFLDELNKSSFGTKLIGTEVGIAWMVRQ